MRLRNILGRSLPARLAPTRLPPIRLPLASPRSAGAGWLPALGLLAAVLPAGPVAAQGFTPAQRQEIVAVVRDAMRRDPTILREAVAALQADDGAREAASVGDAVRANQGALTHTAGDPMAGNAGGDVTVVEFYDPRCPYCRAMLPVIDGLLAGDAKLRVVFKDIPILGPGSVLESKALLAAQMQGGDAAYLRLQGVLMHDSAQPTPATLRQDARNAGLDPDRVLADMNAPAVQARIDANLALAQALHVQGTPALVVGSQMIPGAVELPALRQAVAAARG